MLQLTMFSRVRRDSMRRTMMVHVVGARRKGKEKGKGESPHTAGRITPVNSCM